MFRLSRISRLPLGLLFTGVAATSFANDESIAPPPRRVPAYCGIYCLYGALNAVGVKCQFADFVSSKYVTSKFGSTIDDLRQAAVDHDAFAETRTDLTAADLKEAPCPVILHVATERRIGIYNHWVLYLGTQGGLAHCRRAARTGADSLRRPACPLGRGRALYRGEASGTSGAGNQAVPRNVIWRIPRRTRWHDRLVRRGSQQTVRCHLPSESLWEPPRCWRSPIIPWHPKACFEMPAPLRWCSNRTCPYRLWKSTLIP